MNSIFVKPITLLFATTLLFTGCNSEKSSESLAYFSTLDSNAETNNIMTWKNLTYKAVASETTGRTWLDRNLGASQACTSLTDVDCFGDYYQWGRDSDGHEKLGSAITLTKFSTLKTNSEQFLINQPDWTLSDEDGIQRAKNWDICPSGYEVPTIEELLAETHGIAENILNIPFSGKRTDDGNMKDENIYASLQSDSISSHFFIKTLHYDTAIHSSYWLETRSTASPVRCIKTPAIDTAVSGLDYTCNPGNSGVTNNFGEFACRVDSMVSFLLGSTFLGEVLATSIITPNTLFANNSEAALNFVQLLQTLDSDENYSNGIDVNQEILSTLGNIDFTSESFDEDIQVSLGDNTILVSEQNALRYIDEKIVVLVAPNYN